MKYIKLFEEYTRGDREMTLTNILNEYKVNGNIYDIKIPELNKDEDWLFKQLMATIDELYENGISSDDYLNTDNWGKKENGDFAVFDIGFGDYFQHFIEEPKILKIEKDGSVIEQIKTLLNIEKSTYMGKGVFGFAHDIGDGKVLKITKDKTEAMNSQLIQGKDMKHLANIYDIYQYDRRNKTWYVIILEKLEIDKNLPNIYKSLKSKFDNMINRHIDPIILTLVKR